MDDRNKILDVTYGSFSCRLEGFDDSVETMKTVVSFFHDLAGHDRFMDVLPQAPDLDTLARLTEKQSGVSVDVAGEGQHVSLRVRQPQAAKERLSLRVTPPPAAHDAPTSFSFKQDDAAAFAEDDDDDFDDLEDFDDPDTAEDATEAAAAEPQEEIEPIDLDSSVAEKLNRIRAVVGRGHMPAKEETYAEDLKEREERSGAANPLAQRLAELAKRNSELRDLAEVSVDDAVETADPSDDANTAMDLDDDYDGDEDLDFDTDDQDEILNAAADDDDAAQASATEPADVTPEDAAQTQSDLDDDRPAAEELGTLVLTSRDAAIDVDTGHDDDSFDDDDDFNLHEEVAKVEAEIASRRGNEVARHGLPRSVDDAMSRILSQTDQHLNQPESRRHRDAFAQLKAAVAATEAARQLGDTGGKTRDTEDDFKEDLGAHEAEEKAEAQSLPTLKLVRTEPEVQKDVPEAAPVDEKHAETKPLDAASARLLNIAARKEKDASVSSGSFAEFAQEQGAKELVDLLEAAAAYISFVEGDSDFSRPQVMRKVQSATTEEISREDGLRSFGRLLRQSKIIKLNNGRFQVSKNSRFRPDDGQAAQG